MCYGEGFPVHAVFEKIFCKYKIFSLKTKNKNQVQLFCSTEKVTKVCNPDGQWFHHPESNRVWTNYTQCQAYTKDKRKVRHKLWLDAAYTVFVSTSLIIVFPPVRHQSLLLSCGWTLFVHSLSDHLSRHLLLLQVSQTVVFLLPDLM